MGKRGLIFLGVVFLGLVVVLGCGGDGSDSTPSSAIYSIMDYFPLGQGDTWTYLSTEDGQQEESTLTVNGVEEVNGINAVKVQEKDGSYMLYTVDANGFSIYGEFDVDDEGEYRITYNPPIRYLPATVTVGTSANGTSTSVYEQGGHTMTGTMTWNANVEGLEDVTVPARTFKNCLRIKIAWNLASSDGSYSESGEETMWLAKDVGIVKEVIKETSRGIEGEESLLETLELIRATVGGTSY